MTGKEAVLTLTRCDGVAEQHWTRQRCRVVRIREFDGADWHETVKALCTDHYLELRRAAEPRHSPE